MIDSRLLDIIERLVIEGTPDYATFLSRAGTPFVSELEFAEAYGRIAYCRQVYPNRPVPVALGTMHRNRPGQPHAAPADTMHDKRPCGGCGGGRTR